MNTNDFTTLLVFEFAYSIVGLHQFGRFNKNGFTGGRFIMDNTLYSSFKCGGYWYDQATITHGGSGIFVDQAFLLRLPQDLLQSSGQAVEGRGHFVPDGCQLGGGVVLNLSGWSQDGISSLDNAGKDRNLTGEVYQT